MARPFPGRQAASSAAYAVVFAVTVALGWLTTPGGDGAPLFWPAGGVAALWLMASATVRQLVVDCVLVLLLGAALAVGLFGVSPGEALVFATGDVVVGLAFRLIWSRSTQRSFAVGVRPRLSSPRDLGVAVVASLAGAVVIVPVAVLFGELFVGGAVPHDVAAAAVRMSCGAFVVTTSVLSIRDARERWRERPVSTAEVVSSRARPGAVQELVFTAAALVVVAGYVFGFSQVRPVSFTMMAAAAWVGFRFAPVVAGSYTLLFGTVAIVATVAGRGVFGLLSSVTERAVLVQLFVALTAAITLMLALGTEERVALLRRLEESERSSREQAELLGAVTEVMNDGLVVIDEDLNLVVANPAIHAMAGALAGDPGRLHAPEKHGLYEADGSPLLDPPHLRAFRGEISPPRDMLHIDPVTGQHSVLQVNTRPLLLHRAHGDQREGSTVSVNLVRDVTRERAQLRELDAFASVVAHDLSNPLMAVGNWAEILDDQLEDLPCDTSEARDSVLRIYRSADDMKGLIADLLTLAQTGLMVVDHVVFDLDDLVDDLVSMIRVGDDAPEFRYGDLGRVRADPTLVRQTLSNLLGNAVKYVAPGTRPRVEVTSRRSPKDDGMVEVSVTDNGIGITAADQGRVFDSFFRGDAARMDYPGTGLGLAICARAVARLGGEIYARPGPEGVGTTITFTLPGDPSGAEEPAPDEPQGDGLTTSAEPPPRRLGSDTAVS